MKARADAAPEADAQATPSASAAAVETKVIQLPRITVLSRLDVSHSLDKKAYEKCKEEYQGKINLAVRKAKELGVSSILVFEGWDAAGKGGAIRRIVAALDARDYQVIPIAAPTEEERAQHYLWRFWRHLSRAGRMTIFDRSWYGRVLVERVEGFATKPSGNERTPKSTTLRTSLSSTASCSASSGFTSARKSSSRASRPGRDRLQALEADRRGLAKSREMGRVRSIGRRHDRAHLDNAGAMDAGGSQ